MARLTLPALHRLSCELLTEELNKLGFKLGASSGGVSVESELYPHLVGHGLGIDLHESDGWRNEEYVHRFWSLQYCLLMRVLMVPYCRPGCFPGKLLRLNQECMSQ